MIESYPPLVQAALFKMTDQQKLTFESEYARQKKQVALYVFLAILFPIQLVLLGRLGLQLIYWVTLGGFGIWYFIEWFLTPKRVQEYNDNIAIDIARNVSLMT